MKDWYLISTLSVFTEGVLHNLFTFCVNEHACGNLDISRRNECCVRKLFPTARDTVTHRSGASIVVGIDNFGRDGETRLREESQCSPNDADSTKMFVSLSKQQPCGATETGNALR